MQYMIGLGPIEPESISFFEQKGEDKEEAARSAVKEFLRYFLSYEDEEIDILEIIETKRYTKEKVIYSAFGSINDVKEVHFWKAASGNDKLMIHNCIPPQLYNRYMTVARKDTELRASDKKLKTQIGWGDKDIEIFTKTKGSEEPLRKVDLADFMGETPLPSCEMNFKWKARPSNKIRRELVFNQGKPQLPSLQQVSSEGPAESLRRQHSSTPSLRETKKHRMEEGSSTSSDETGGEDYETPDGKRYTRSDHEKSI